jgi:hypothetical protein
VIFSVFDYTAQRYNYFEAPGVTPPHGWFRKPTPGNLMQPEELAAHLPDGAALVGSGLLPKGVIATDVPGVGTVDTNGPTSGAGAGLGTYAGPSTQRGQRGPGVRPQGINTDAAWESPDSRGRT